MRIVGQNADQSYMVDPENGQPPVPVAPRGLAALGLSVPDQAAAPVPDGSSSGGGTGGGGPMPGGGMGGQSGGGPVGGLLPTGTGGNTGGGMPGAGQQPLGGSTGGAPPPTMPEPQQASVTSDEPSRQPMPQGLIMPPQPPASARPAAVPPRVGVGNSNQRVYDQATTALQQANTNQANLEQYLAQEKTKILQSDLPEGQKYERYLQLRQQDFKARTEQMLAQQKQIADDVAATKIDPHHFWASQDTGSKVIAGLGMLLGAFGGEGGNKAVEQIDKAINRDIDAQKANLANKRENLAAQQSIYANYLRAFQDDGLATAATRVAHLDNVQKQADALTAGMQGPLAAANAQKLNADLGRVQAAADADFQAKVQEATARGMQLEMQRDELMLHRQQIQAVLNGQLNPALMDEKQQARLLRLGEDENGRPQYAMAASEKGADEARPRLAEMAAARDKMRALQDLMRRAGRGLLPYEEATSQARVLASSLKASLLKSSGFSRPTAESLGLFADAVADDPRAIFEHNVQARLAQAGKNLDSDQENLLRTYTLR